jgi:3' exoribonuclease, RNase T-like
MLVFLDTEHTGYSRPDPKLISLALVSEDGRRELYFELTDSWKFDDCDNFVREQVLPLLSGPKLTTMEARAQIRSWLVHAPRNVRLACDSAIDVFFLKNVIDSPHLENLNTDYFDLRPLIDSSVYDQAVSSFHKAGSPRHHALADARAHRQGWLAWMDSRKSARF